MSEIEKIYQKLCRVDPVEADTIESHPNVSDADAIAALRDQLREQLSSGEDMGLSSDGIFLNPADPVDPSCFKPVDKCGLA